MLTVQEYDQIDALGEFRAAWKGLLVETPGATFFQSLDWLEVYWRHFGQRQRLRVLVVFSGSEPSGVVPLVVRHEKTRVGRLRILTYPLENWGSFFGPVGPRPGETLAAALGHIRRTERDWDAIELRWAGAPETDPAEIAAAMREARFQAHRTLWNTTAMVDLGGDWETYLAGRPRAWRRNLRAAWRKLAEQGDARFVRFRAGTPGTDPDDPRWDLYGACETVAARSWQAEATNGTTLTHARVRGFLRDAHAAAVRLRAADLNLLLLDDEPLAFVCNYAWQGRVCGLRLGFDAGRFRHGAGTLLLAESIRDGFARGDRWFDLGSGSLESKRHLQNVLAPILRFSHFHPTAIRAQALRAKRWSEARWLDGRLPSIAVGRDQDPAADRR